jgi:hypothetical protein
MKPGRVQRGRARAAVRGLAALLLGAAPIGAAAQAPGQLHVLVVAGLGGEPRYEEQFVQQAEAIAKAALAATGDPARVVVLSGPAATRSAVSARLRGLRQSVKRADQLAVILIGHGSYDGEQYKLNLPGPDLGAQALARLLDSVPASRQLIVNASSASGGVLEVLGRKGRVLITATRSGREQGATQFASYWALALSSPAADLDKDGWITAREAFDFTARRVADHYKRDVSLATEHPQLVGESPAPFRLARLGAQGDRAGAGFVGPATAALIQRRDALVQGVEALRARKAQMQGEAYLRELEQRLVELAELEERIEAGGSTAPQEEP